MFLSLWKDFGARFKGIIESLKKQQEFIDKEAISFDIVEARDSRRRMQDQILENQKRELKIIEENEKRVSISQLLHSMAWLSADDKPQEIAHDKTSRRRHGVTCQWVADELQLKNWMKDDAKSSCLWINGKPGSGMPELCTNVILLLII